MRVLEWYGSGPPRPGSSMAPEGIELPDAFPPAMAQVFRVRDINGERLTSIQAADNPEATVWRAISARRRDGHWGYPYDDYVLEANVGRYVLVASYQGAERISLHRLGTVSSVMSAEPPRPMKGTVRLARQENQRAPLDGGGGDPRPRGC